MPIMMELIAYILIWWITWFVVLPWGMQSTDSLGEGHDPGAPETPNFKRKIVITTLISFLVWGGYLALLYCNIISTELFEKWFLSLG